MHSVSQSTEATSKASAGRSRTRLVLSLFVTVAVVVCVTVFSTGTKSHLNLNNNVASAEKIDSDAYSYHVASGNTFVWNEVVGFFQANGCPGIRRNENGWNEDTMIPISCEITDTQITAVARGIHRAWYIIHEVTITKSTSNPVVATGTVKKGELKLGGQWKQALTTRSAQIFLYFKQHTAIQAPSLFSTMHAKILNPEGLPKQMAVRSSDQKSYTFFPQVYGEGHSSFVAVDSWSIAADGSLKNVDIIYVHSGFLHCSHDTSTPTGSMVTQQYNVGATLPLAGSPICQASSIVYYY